MNVENLKITTYADNVKDLPDYPSDEGYTAEMLKAMFDARSDNEIKEKHNALVDAVGEKFSELKTADGNLERSAKEYADGIISEHDKDEDSHRDIRELISEVKTALSGLEESAIKDSDINNELSEELNEEQLSKPPSTQYVRDLLERLETALGVMESDTGHSEKMVRRANVAFYANEADIAFKDTKGNRIDTTYATKNELETAVGDISVALDELHAYAEARVGGAE